MVTDEGNLFMVLAILFTKIGRLVIQTHTLQWLIQYCYFPFIVFVKKIYIYLLCFLFFLSFILYKMNVERKRVKNWSIYLLQSLKWQFVVLVIWQKEYEQLCRKIQNASQKSNPCPLVGEYAVFSKTELKNHPSIIKVHYIKHFYKYSYITFYWRW